MRFPFSFIAHLNCLPFPRVRRSETSLIAEIWSSQVKMANEVEAQGLNPGLIVLLVVGGLMLTFLVGNYMLYTYAQKTLPMKKKKPLSKKKMKKERMKKGIAPPGE